MGEPLRGGGKMTTAANNEKEFELPGEHLAVFQIISNSKEKYVTRNSILAQLEGKRMNGRRLSQIINDLIMVYGMPVGASSRQDTKGYFIIKTDLDKYLAGRDLYARASSMMKRYEAVQKIEPQGE